MTCAAGPIDGAIIMRRSGHMRCGTVRVTGIAGDGRPVGKNLTPDHVRAITKSEHVAGSVCIVTGGTDDRRTGEHVVAVGGVQLGKMTKFSPKRICAVSRNFLTA